VTARNENESNLLKTNNPAKSLDFVANDFKNLRQDCETARFGWGNFGFALAPFGCFEAKTKDAGGVAGAARASLPRSQPFIFWPKICKVAKLRKSAAKSLKDKRRVNLCAPLNPFSARRARPQKRRFRLPASNRARPIEESQLSNIVASLPRRR
jgi:hypothetical protein